MYCDFHNWHYVRGCSESALRLCDNDGLGLLYISRLSKKPLKLIFHNFVRHILGRRIKIEN